VVCVVVAIPVGLLIGIATREGRGRSVHLGFGGLTGLALSVPDYLLAVGLVFVFAVSATIFPVAGMTGRLRRATRRRARAGVELLDDRRELAQRTHV